jgi:hypothetical protein
MIALNARSVHSLCTNFPGSPKIFCALNELTIGNYGAEGGNRTRTRVSSPRILSPIWGFCLLPLKPLFSYFTELFAQFGFRPDRAKTPFSKALCTRCALTFSSFGAMNTAQDRAGYYEQDAGTGGLMGSGKSRI